MKLIDTFTADPKQQQIIVLDDSKRIDFSMRYVANQQGWFYSFVYGTFQVNNSRIVTAPNMLRAYRNIINFGFACKTTDGYEPVFIDDFSTGRAQFFVLNAQDVLDVEADIINA